MALVYDGISCALCGTPLDSSQSFYATSAFLDPDHPLWKFSDAALHWECFEEWPNHIDFARLYFETQVKSAESNPWWGIAYLTDRVMVEVNPHQPVCAVQIIVAATSGGPKIAGADWERWIETSDTSSMHRFEARALEEVLPEIRKHVPTRSALVSQVDWAVKRELHEQWKNRNVTHSRLRYEQRYARPRNHTKACCQMQKSGVSCPYCFSAEDIHFVDKTPNEKSYFVCAACSQEFGPVEYMVHRECGRMVSEIIDGKWPS
jgi:hypothetical protein